MMMMMGDETIIEIEGTEPSIIACVNCGGELSNKAGPWRHVIEERGEKRLVRTIHEGCQKPEPPVPTRDVQLRAENYSHSHFDGPRMVNQSLVYMYADYLDSWNNSSSWNSYRPLIVAASRGLGKTYNLMAHFHDMAIADPDFLPLFLCFKKNNRIEPLDLESIASAELWGGRIDEARSLSLDALYERASVIILDDIHYICEEIVNGNQSKEELIFYLEKLSMLSKKKPVILISETQLSSYSGTVADERFDRICVEFGDISSFDLRNAVGMSPSEALKMYRLHPGSNIKQVPKIDYELWSGFFDHYSVEATEEIRMLLWDSTSNMRELMVYFLFLKLQPALSLDAFLVIGGNTLDKRDVTGIALANMGPFYSRITPKTFGRYFKEYKIPKQVKEYVPKPMEEEPKRHAELRKASIINKSRDIYKKLLGVIPPGRLNTACVNATTHYSFLTYDVRKVEKLWIPRHASLASFELIRDLLLYTQDTELITQILKELLDEINEKETD